MSQQQPSGLAAAKTPSLYQPEQQAQLQPFYGPHHDDYHLFDYDVHDYDIHDYDPYGHLLHDFHVHDLHVHDLNVHDDYPFAPYHGHAWAHPLTHLGPPCLCPLHPLPHYHAPVFLPAPVVPCFM